MFCEQAPEPDALIARVLAAHRTVAGPDTLARASQRTAEYWDAYFRDSYVAVSGDPAPVAPVPAEIADVCVEPQAVLFRESADGAAPGHAGVPESSCWTGSRVTRSYLLTTYMFACSAGGRMPLNFNGLIFNLMPGANRHLGFDAFCRTFAAQPSGEPDLEINPDEKGWESCIQLWQNLRLLYAPMLARGEYDSIRRLFGYYRAFWDINRIRARVYYQAEGQYNTEMTHSFGLLPLSVYGTDRTNLKDGYARNRWGGAVDISPGLELSCMMLDYYNHTRDGDFLRDELLPYAEDLLHFVETRFTGRNGGKLRLTDLQSVETYFDTLNPITVVAGLWAVTDRILSLPAQEVPGRAFFQAYRDIIPPLPLAKDMYGNDVLAPAAQHSPQRMNVENPELYAVYPFRLFTWYAATDPGRRTSRGRRLNPRQGVTIARTGPRSGASGQLTGNAPPLRVGRLYQLMDHGKMRSEVTVSKSSLTSEKQAALASRGTDADICPADRSMTADSECHSREGHGPLSGVIRSVALRSGRSAP